jgi:acyl carrier protein
VVPNVPSNHRCRRKLQSHFLGTAVALRFHRTINIVLHTWIGIIASRFGTEEIALVRFDLLRRNGSMSACEQTYGKVVRVLVEALNVEEDEITPAARLQGDLGAESIDFLDIVFRLEREFAIKIPRGELFPESVFQGDPEFAREGRVTDKGLSELRSRMPYADLDGFDHDRRLSGVPNLFTVDLITRYVAWKLGQGAEAGPNGNGAVLATGSTPERSLS